MLRAFAAFLVLFFLLSLVVSLNVTGYVFGMAALTLFAIDLLTAHSDKAPRPLRMRGEPLR